MPSLPDTAVIILLGLLLFGPKGLAQIARQLGKLMGEFRRASNEFRMQMEEELRISEQADRQKQIAAVEAVAPAAPVLDSTPVEAIGGNHAELTAPHFEPASESATPHEALPIATSGEMSIMPPATGLPAPRSSSLASLIDAVPKVDPPGAHTNGDSASSHYDEDRRTMRHVDKTSEVPQDAEAEESLHG